MSGGIIRCLLCLLGNKLISNDIPFRLIAVFISATDLSSISLLLQAKGCCTIALANAVNCLAYVGMVGQR